MFILHCLATKRSLPTNYTKQIGNSLPLNNYYSDYNVSAGNIVRSADYLNVLNNHFLNSLMARVYYKMTISGFIGIKL